MEVTVYGRKGCKFCDLSKDHLKGLGVDFKYIDINEDFEAAMELKNKFGMFKTVPQIVVDNELIGGYTELVKTIN